MPSVPPPVQFTVQWLVAVTGKVPPLEVCVYRKPQVGESVATWLPIAAWLNAVPAPQLTVCPSPLDQVTPVTVAVAVTVTPPMVAVFEYGPYDKGCGFSTQSQTGMPTQVRRYGAVPAGSSVCVFSAGAMPMSMPSSANVFTRRPRPVLACRC